MLQGVMDFFWLTAGASAMRTKIVHDGLFPVSVMGGKGIALRAAAFCVGIACVWLAGFSGDSLMAQSTTSSNSVPGKSAGVASTNADDVVSNETHVIAAGDKLSFRVVEDRNEPKILTVAAGGEIEVPYLGRMVVAGKTVIQARQEIKAQLEKDLYYQATVVLSIEEVATKPVGPPATAKAKQVVVVGQVRSQGVQEMPYGEKYMVSRAILKAGGFSAFANGRKVQITRKAEGKKTERIVVDVLSILKEGKVENDVELQPDDMVIVPEKFVNF
jgi:polysaccharide export outer membrane protein